MKQESANGPGCPLTASPHLRHCTPTEAALIVASIDTSQCYDRISHVMVVLSLWATSVSENTVIKMLGPIHKMKYHLQAGYGKSKSYFGGLGLGMNGGWV